MIDIIDLCNVQIRRYKQLSKTKRANEKEFIAYEKGAHDFACLIKSELSLQNVGDRLNGANK